MPAATDLVVKAVRELVAHNNTHAAVVDRPA
jgi:hypothetical protein